MEGKNIFLACKTFYRQIDETSCEYLKIKNVMWENLLGKYIENSNF